MRQLTAFIIVAPTIVGGRANAGVEYTFEDVEWETWAGKFTTIGFTELPVDTFVTEQYSHLGAHFIDPPDIIRHGFPLYHDGAGIAGFDAIHVTFDHALHFVAMRFSGLMKVELISDGETIWNPLLHTFESFVGFRSNEPFDEIILTDLDGFVFLDDLHFGPPIPAAPAFALLMVSLTSPKTRKRRG